MRAASRDWVNSPDGAIPGVGRFRLRLGRRRAQFTYVASLGIATPEASKGATRVSAEEVAELAKQGVAVVDTRTQKEYDNEHVRGAHPRAVRREEPEGRRLRCARRTTSRR